MKTKVDETSTIQSLTVSNGEYEEYDPEFNVCIDTSSPYSGTDSPIGQPTHPVNNMKDALAIVEKYYTDKGSKPELEPCPFCGGEGKANNAEFRDVVVSGDLDEDGEPYVFQNINADR